MRAFVRAWMVGAAVVALALGLGVTPAQAAPFVYVTNTATDFISQYDVGPGGALAPLSPATAPAGPYSWGVAVSPDSRSVYVANVGSLAPSGSGTGAVSQYDVGPGGALSPKSPATVPAGERPIGVAVSPDGRSVYVTNGESDTLSQYSVGPGGGLSPKSPATVPTGPNPAGVAVSPDGGSVYVANFDSVSQYSVGPGGALSPKSPATVPAGERPIGVAVSPDGGSVYVLDVGSEAVFQFNVGPGGGLSPKSAASVPTGYAPFGLAVSPLPRVPTSKNQCTNGGWRNFPGFKNQGDCVSHVATKGKNPPAQP
jgi:DNA-binding beta-propeller fold protein YncE